MTGNHTSSPELSADGWDEIEDFLATVSQLSQSGGSLPKLAGEVIDLTVEYLQANGGAFWRIDQELGWVRVDQRSLAAGSELGLDPDGSAGSDLEGFLQSVIASGGAFTQQAASPDGPAQRSIWVGAPVAGEGHVAGVIQIVQPSNLGEKSLRGSERLLEMVSELVGDYFQRLLVSALQQNTVEFQRYESLVRRVHSHLDLAATAFHLVNEGRLFVGCDRVTLAVPKGRRLRVQAVSGVDRIDSRSHFVVCAEELINAVAPSQNWLRYRGVTEGLPPQMEKPLTEFADEALSQSADVVPLLADSDSGEESLVGMLLFEQFEGDQLDHQVDRIVLLSNLASAALRNSLDYQTLPFLNASRWVRSVVRFGSVRRLQLLVGAIATVMVLLSLVLVPVPFYVVADGEAWPQVRRNLFAPGDGEVVKVLAGHDETVRAGQELLQLRSPPLELEFQRLRGEYQTTEKKLLAIASARVGSEASERRERFSGQLAAEEQELRQQLKSLEKQLELMRQQRELLQIRSPIDGRLLTWDPEDLLTDRPVERGQLLMTVADLEGPWVIEIRLPDSRAGHVIDAQGDANGPLPVKFAIPADVADTLEGELTEISRRTEVVHEGKPVAKAIVSIDSEAAADLRPGTALKAKVHCGNRSVGFVLFHGVFEKLRLWFFF